MNVLAAVLLGILKEIAMVVCTDNFAVMSASLRTFQTHACDGEELRIECQPHTVISINYAHYGINSETENCPDTAFAPSSSRYEETDEKKPCISQTALKVIEGKCQEQVVCRMIASPKTFWEDPCPGVRKYAEVAYKCRPVEFINKIACEGEKLNLQCDETLRLLIYSATFGSTKGSVPECPQDIENAEECYSSSAVKEVMHACSGKQNCTLNADIQSMGNPKCSSWIRKHLKVVYTCVPQVVLKSSKNEGRQLDNSAEETTKDVEVHTTSYPAWVGNIDQRIPSYLLPRSPPTTVTKLQMQRDYAIHGGTNSTSSDDRKLVDFLAEWLAAQKYIEGNKQKLIIYVSVSLAVGILLFAAIVFVHFFVLRSLDKEPEKKEVPPITDDDFFTESDLEQFEDDPLNMMNSLPRKISEAIPRTPISDGPGTNHYFS